MSSVTELIKKLSSGQKATTGVIISTKAGVLMVSTANGAQVMSQTGATKYRPGDRVQVQGQIIIGKIASETGVRVYVV